MLGVSVRALADAIAPALIAALAMAMIVTLVGSRLAADAATSRDLAILVAVGAAAYAGWLMLFSRSVVRDLIALVRKQPLQAD